MIRNQQKSRWLLVLMSRDDQVWVWVWVWVWSLKAELSMNEALTCPTVSERSTSPQLDGDLQPGGPSEQAGANPQTVADCSSAWVTWPGRVAEDLQPEHRDPQSSAEASLVRVEMKMKSPVCIMHECFVLHPKADELLLQVSALVPSCCSSWRAASMFNAGL